MRKLFILALVCLVSTMVGQKDSTKSKISGYTSVGLSMSNGNDFKASSYLAVEAGAMYKNISLGGIFGRGNLTGIGKSNDVLGNYYYEFKTGGYFPLGESLTGNVIFGWGGYFNSKHTLIEYGVGMSYSCGKMGYGVTYSNWDGVNYITPSITLNF